jgi:membrane protein
LRAPVLNIAMHRMGRAWQVLSQVWAVADRTHLSMIAAGIAFFGIFAVFPALAALIGVFGLFADPMVVEQQLELMEEFIPPDAYDLLHDQVMALINAQGGTLGWTTVLSLGVALWSARLGVSSLVLGINAIHGTPNRGGFWHAILSILLTLWLLSVAMVALFAVIVAPILLAVLPLPPATGWLFEAVRWLVALAALLLALGILYRFGPNGAIRMAWITPGAILVIVLWLAASAAFSLYVGNFGSYNEIYGSIGAVVAMMMWLYITAYLIMLGAALNLVLRGEDIPLDHGM